MKPAPIDDEDDEPGFIQRHKGMLIVGVLALGAGGWFYANHTPSKSTPQRKMDVVMVMPLIAQPPPPLITPPPPKQEEPPPPDEKEVAAEEEPPPDAPEAKPADPAPADEPLGTAIGGGDGSGLGLGSGKGGSGMIGGTGGKSYSERGRWQGRISRQLQALLQQDSVLKFAKGSVLVRVWLEPSGRIIRVALSGSTGNAAQDNALRQSALVGRMIEPAPPDTPMPVRFRYTAQ